MEVKRPGKPLESIIFDVLDQAVIPKMDEDAKALAEQVRQELVDNIRADMMGFKEDPDSDYQKRKFREHPGEPPLVATEEYINSIKVERIDQPGTHGWTIGVGDALHFGERDASPIPMKELATILEYGLPEKNIPPRPHWRPALQKLRYMRILLTTTMRERAVKAAREEIGRQLKSLPQTKTTE